MIKNSMKKYQRKKVTNIEDLKNDLIELNKQGVDIVQSDVVAALDRFEMTDDEIDQFYDWTSSVGIDLIDESEDEEDLEDDDYLASESDDEDEEDDSEKNIVINYEQASAYTKVNDPVKMYLKEIGRVPLLKADEEVEIAKRIEYGLANPDDPKAVADGSDAKNELISANLLLVVAIAKKYTGRGMLFLDLIQEGNMGLIKAVDRYNYTKGYRFSSYAAWSIHHSITRAIKDFMYGPHDPFRSRTYYRKVINVKESLAKELGREPTETEITERMNSLLGETEKIESYSREKKRGENGSPLKESEALLDDNQSFDLSTRGLTEREAKVICLRFGLDDGGKGKTIDEVAAELHITRERVLAIEHRAIHKIKNM